jgi:transposase
MSNYSSEKKVKTIKRKIRRKWNSEEKLQIELDGLRGEDSLAEICAGKALVKMCITRWYRHWICV